jgi:hypothetical protein
MYESRNDYCHVRPSFQDWEAFVIGVLRRLPAFLVAFAAPAVVSLNPPSALTGAITRKSIGAALLRSRVIAFPGRTSICWPQKFSKKGLQTDRLRRKEVIGSRNGPILPTRGGIRFHNLLILARASGGSIVS